MSDYRERTWVFWALNTLLILGLGLSAGCSSKKKPSPLCGLHRWLQLLRQGRTDYRRRWPGLGQYPEHCPAEVAEQLCALCRQVWGDAEDLPGGDGQVQELGSSR